MKVNLILAITRPSFATTILDRSILAPFVSTTRWPSSQGGDQFRTNDVVAELWKQSFDNKIESCCFDGFWILYGGDSFNNATSIQVVILMIRIRMVMLMSTWKCKVSCTQESWWGFGSSYCTDVPTQFRNRASSLRLRFCWLQIGKVQICK